MFILWQLQFAPRASWWRRLSTAFEVTFVVVETNNDQFIGRAASATVMIERSWADADQAAVVYLKNLVFVFFAAKDEVFVLKRHSTGVVNFFSAEVKRGQQLAHRAD